ncbi:MAG: hypothetical protein GYA24_10880, partial [Candidatus Lokiarchaeota archaeon]|nr:hypothetical protein [Candidatus Lokiarchaeota archaeon]
MLVLKDDENEIIGYQFGDSFGLDVAAHTTSRLIAAFDGDLFFAPSSTDLVIPGTTVTIARETPVIELLPGYGFDAYEDEQGNTQYEIRVEYDSEEAVWALGSMYDNDDHRYQVNTLASQPMQVYKLNYDPANKWSRAAVTHVSTWGTAVASTAILSTRIKQTFVATTTYLSSVTVGIPTTPSIVPSSLDQVIISLHEIDTDDGMIGSALHTESVHSALWTGPESTFQFFYSELSIGKTYAMIFSGFDVKMDGTRVEMAVPMLASVAGYAGGCIETWDETQGAFVADVSMDARVRTNEYYAGFSLKAQILDPRPAEQGGGWFDWQRVILGPAGEFVFPVHTGIDISTSGTSTIVTPSSEAYLAPGAYTVRIYFPGNEWYEAASSREFTIVVSSAQTELAYIPDPESIQSTTDRQFSIESRSYESHEFSTEAGLPYTRVELSRSYNDPASFSFELREKASGLPVPNAPVFIQIGIVPNTINWSEDYFADSAPDYLARYDSEIPHLLNRLYVQGKYDAPLCYPYQDLVTGAWEAWGPYAYMVQQTDSAGRVTFDFTTAKLPVDQLVANIAEVLRESFTSITEVKLFIRVFHRNSFIYENMRINGDTMFARGDDTAGRVFTTSDATPAGEYANTYWSNCYLEGSLAIMPEDVLLRGGYTEGVISGEEGFVVNVAVKHANIKADGTRVAETDPISAGGFDDYRVPAHSVLGALYLFGLDGTSYTNYPVYAETDAQGMLSFVISASTLGEEWFKIVPGFYRGKVKVIGNDYINPFPASETEYYEFDIVIKNGQTRDLTKAPYQVDFRANLDNAIAHVARDDPDQSAISITFGPVIHDASYFIIETGDGIRRAVYLNLDGSTVSPAGSHFIHADTVHRVDIPSTYASSPDIIASRTCASLNGILRDGLPMFVVSQVDGVLTIRPRAPMSITGAAYSATDGTTSQIVVKELAFLAPSDQSVMEPAFPMIRGEFVVLETSA